MFDVIWEFIKSVWDSIKKFYYNIISFKQHILKFFKDPSILRKIQEDKDNIAVVIRERLNSGEFTTINVLFNTDEGEVVDYQNCAEANIAPELDAETNRNFGGKDMMVLR